MPALLHALSRNASAELLHGESVDLLNVAFDIEADPVKPDDEDAMKRNLRVDDIFTRELPWLTGDLDAIRKLCDLFYEDFDKPADTLLRAALLARRYEIEEVKERNTSRPLLALVTPMVGIWALRWTVRLEDVEKPENAAGQTFRTDIRKDREGLRDPQVNKNPEWSKDPENPWSDTQDSPGGESGNHIPKGKEPVFGYTEYLNDGVMDPETLEKVRDRISRVNGIMKGIVARLTGE